MTLKEYFVQVILVYSIKEMEENVYMKRLLVYSKKYWIQMIAAAISSVTASISTVMVIDILREIIDIISKGNMMQEIRYIILKIIIVICVGIVSNYMLVAMTGFVGAGLLKDFRNDAVNSLINTYSENAVLEAMSVFMKKKTVIMVSHRMTGAEKFDRVVRMD